MGVNVVIPLDIRMAHTWVLIAVVQPSKTKFLSISTTMVNKDQ